MDSIATIRAEHSKLGERITALEASLESRRIEIPARTILLGPGEGYAGFVPSIDGKPGYDLILLGEQCFDIDWDDAMKWAAGVGGDLPTPQEQSLLYAYLKDRFQSRWYWSNAPHESSSSSAWAQFFGGGYQYVDRKYDRLAACAVRRSIIQ